MSKKQVNPLLGPGVSNFKLEDSFGVQPTLIVPQTTTNVSLEPPKSATLFSDQSQAGAFSDISLNSNSPVKPPELTPGSSAQVAPPPVMSLGPPQPGLFLLPGSGGPPATPTITPSSAKSGKMIYIQI